MIVRTRNYACEALDERGDSRQLHWQKGMFLRNKKYGEALLELHGHELLIYVEAIWPEFFLNILKETLQKLITDNWPGMEGRYYFAVPCGDRQNGQFCKGRFDIDALRQFLEEGDETIRCQVCRNRQKIIELLYGFEEEDSRQQLARIETKMDKGFQDIHSELKELESRVANYVWAILRAVASESREGPRLFTIEAEDKNWNLMNKIYCLSSFGAKPKAASILFLKKVKGPMKLRNPMNG